MIFFAYPGGVSGTPLYAINGVVKVIDKAWSLTDWIGVLDPLVHKSVSPVIFNGNYLTICLKQIFPNNIEYIFKIINYI